MRYRPLGRTGQFVSEICLGAMTFHGGGGFWRAIGTLDQAASTKLVARALEAGVNFIDTANVYSEGQSEVQVGQALRDLGVKREDVIIATKVRGRMGQGPNAVGLSRGHIMDQVAASLKRLGLDHIDLYQVHSFDPVTPLEETLRALDDCVSRGFVRTIGCSNFAAWQIMKALGISDKRGFARFETVQAYYSIAGRELEREIVPAGRGPGPRRDGVEPARRRISFGQVHPREPAATTIRGARCSISRRSTRSAPTTSSTRWRRSPRRTASSVARVALAWLLQRKGVMSVIIGAKTVEQLDDNLAAAELTLSAGRDGGPRQGERAQARISGLDAGANGRRTRSGGEGLTALPFPAERRRFTGGDAMRKVKWGVLGVAKIAVEKVIPAMQQGEASHIAAIASRDLGKARAAADKLGIERAFGSYEALLADAEIEAIYNPLPNELHVPWTLRALAAGKHVLCEKPIGSTPRKRAR